jgi:antirestriction protein ArdC
MASDKKVDVYQMVTDMMIEKLEKGTVPWHKPWSGGKFAMPVNLASKKQYRGINILILGLSDYNCPMWGTYKQIQEKGGKVRAGEHGTHIVYWTTFEVTENKVDELTGEVSTYTKKIPYLKYYTVFNLEQQDGIDWKKICGVIESDDNTLHVDPIEECEKVITGYKNAPEYRFGGNRAFYRPSEDFIQLPEISSFDSMEEYYSTHFHEDIHSTGHSSRLNRSVGMAAFGSGEYSEEELVGEMGAAMLCAVSGIVNATADNSAAYIASWLTQLQNDKKLIIKSASAAQKAVDYILGTSNVTVEEGA